MFVVYLLNLIIGVYLLFVAVSLLLSGQLLWFLFYIFIGLSLLSWLLGLLQLPFIAIPSLYAGKLANLDFNENTVTAEVLDENNRVVGLVEGDTVITVRMAKYFVILYLINLFSLILSPSESVYTANLTGYITGPFIWMVTETLSLGLFYLVYHKIRYKFWLPIDKRKFFIIVWKISSFVYGTICVVLYILLPLVVGLLL